MLFEAKQTSPPERRLFVVGLGVFLNGMLGLINPFFGDVEGMRFRFWLGVKSIRGLKYFRLDG